MRLLETYVRHKPSTQERLSQRCRDRVFRPQRSPRKAIHWQRSHPKHCFLHLSTDVCSHYVRKVDFLAFHMIDLLFRPMLAIGGFADRAHLGPLLAFVFAWSTLVYDPIACWTWNSNGTNFSLRVRTLPIGNIQDGVLPMVHTTLREEPRCIFPRGAPLSRSRSISANVEAMAQKH